MTTLRLLLGDQLNRTHSWFQQKNPHVIYLMAEMPQELGYVKHHIQKIASFFLAMRTFAQELQANGHELLYFKIDENPHQTLPDLLNHIITKYQITHFEYQLPDEFRLDLQLQLFCKSLNISSQVYDTQHFYTSRTELAEFFEGKKQLIMESFYRNMRKKHNVLMVGQQPLGGQWNYDHDNRNKWSEAFEIPDFLDFSNDATAVKQDLDKVDCHYFGSINWTKLSWPIDRKQAYKSLHYFLQYLLPNFGTYQDAMHTNQKFLFHSRLSFALNSKIISPKEVIDDTLTYYYQNQEKITLAQVEGFIRQIIGWREYVRGIYWKEMPSYASKNELHNHNPLPNFYWTAQTKMNCMQHSLGQSLEESYAHHIQRLMVIGNFSLLANLHPDEVDAWYLGVYIDAIEWVEMPNTRGMSQYADGGILATKPYVSSGSYINKMSNYCKDCAYNVKEKTTDNACPFNSLYWNFLDDKRAYLQNNQRMKMMYAVLNKMKPEELVELKEKASKILANIDTI